MQLPEFLSGIEEWMRKMEDKNTRLTQEMLANQAWEMILLDILILAIIPAIGEEFLFRGIIQRGIEKKTHNIHFAIWCSAFIFSTIHLQFYGFFPRMFMGAIFGYMLYWGKSIWIPIACHFTNNFLVIITSHLYPEEFETSYLDNIGKENLLIAVISLLIFSFFIFLYKKISTK
jgi:membrane protease YdiL (CAAX protease family)